MHHINTDTSFLRDVSGFSEAIKLSDIQECSICFCDKADHEFVRLSVCDHFFCKSCFKEYINSELTNLNIFKIKCPEQCCSQILNFAILQETLDDQTLRKYQDLLLKKIDHQARTANICPKPGCSKLLSLSNETCHSNCSCGAVICNLCGGLSHEGKSCVAALDPEFEIYAAENDLKFCIMCKTAVVRVEGCTHITCPICDYEWCWLCGREYSNVHEPKCPKEWSPLPPYMILQEGLQKSPSKRLLNKIFAVFLLVLSEILFWPYKCLGFVEEVRSPNRSWDYKIKLVLGAILFHIVYLINFGSLFFLWLEFPGKTDQLLPYVILIGVLPCVLRLFYLAFFKDRFKKRWQTRNVNRFSYTSAYKPEKSDLDQHVAIEVEPEVVVVLN